MRRRPAANVRVERVTDFAGDPRGEAIAGPLLEDLGAILNGHSGTIYAGAPGDPSTTFTGYAKGGLIVPAIRQSSVVITDNPSRLDNARSTLTNAQTAIFAARLRRQRR